MNTERKPGYYWAKLKGYSSEDIFKYSGEIFMNGINGFLVDEFEWIADNQMPSNTWIKEMDQTLSALLKYSKKDSRFRLGESVPERIIELLDDNRSMEEELNKKRDSVIWEIIQEFQEMRTCDDEYNESIPNKHLLSYNDVEFHLYGLLEKKEPPEAPADLLNSEVEKTNTTISRLLKLKDKIKDLTIDDIAREIGEIIGDAVKHDSITK